MKAVVIGAGIVGASIGYHLAARGADVTLIDKNKPGSGASSHSFAWINAGPKSPFEYHDLNRRSLEMWERFAQKLNTDVGLRWGGKVSWEAETHRAEELRQRTKLLQDWGYPIREISSDSLCAMVPGLDPGPVSVAEYSEIDGHVEPPRVVGACVQKVSDLGGTVLINTEVLSFGRDTQGNVNKVVTSIGDLVCDVVVIAAGVDSSRLAEMIGADVPQQESPGVVVRTDARPALLSNVPVVYMPPINQRERQVHIRQLMDGSFMIGEGSQESMALDDSPQHATELLGRATHYFPELAGTEAIAEPVGYRPMPLDSYPVIGWTQESSNVYISLTHSGVTLAPLIGQVASMEILARADLVFMSSYRPNRKFILTVHDH